MEKTPSMNRLRFVIFPGLLILASGCAAHQDSPAQAQAPQTSTASMAPMAGCGMMVNGKMVDKDTAGNACMNMNKPGSMMPNGVTMHSDPGAAAQPK